MPKMGLFIMLLLKNLDFSSPGWSASILVTQALYNLGPAPVCPHRLLFLAGTCHTRHIELFCVAPMPLHSSLGLKYNILPLTLSLPRNPVPVLRTQLKYPLTPCTTPQSCLYGRASLNCKHHSHTVPPNRPALLKPR